MNQPPNFSSYLYKFGDGCWRRFFFTVSPQVLLYYESKFDSSSLSGFVDRSLISRLDSLGEDFVEGKKLFTFRIHLLGDTVWTIGARKTSTRLAFLNELEPHNEGAMTPKSFMVRKTQKASGKSLFAETSPKVRDASDCTKKNPEPLQFLARTLSCYEGEFDRSKESESVRAKRLESVLDEVMNNEEDEKLMTVKESVWENLEVCF